MPPRRFEDVADKACAYLSSFRTSWQPLVQEVTNKAIKRVFNGVFEQQQERIRRNRHLSIHEEEELMSTSSSGSSSGDDSIDKEDSSSASSSESDSDNNDNSSNSSSKNRRCAKRKERSFDEGGEGDVSSMDDDDAESLSTREDKFVDAEESSEALYESPNDERTKDGHERIWRQKKRRRIAYKEVTDDDVTAVLEGNGGEEEDHDDDGGLKAAQFSHGTEIRKHFPTEGWFDGYIVEELWIRSRKKWSYVVKYYEREETETMDEEMIADITIPDCRCSDPTVFDFEEFTDLVWEQLNPERTEKSSAVRRANTRISNEDSGTQHSAQYGRILPEATDSIFRVLRLKRSDVFLDVGHGIGNACFQAAYCRGCEARGIEIVKDRYDVSLHFSRLVKERARKLDGDFGLTRIPGKVVLRHGDLTKARHHNWLVTSNKVFVNNFNGVFAERMVSQTTEWHLDHYIAGLFASMEEDSLMITLSDLQLGPTQSVVNKWRVENGLPPSPNGSFFEVVKIILGEAGEVFSWSTSCKTPAYAYVYRRVRQDPNLKMATIMCCNKYCQHSRLGTLIPAVAFNKEGKAVVGTCDCKTSPKSMRRIPIVTLEEFVNGDPTYRDWGVGE